MYRVWCLWRIFQADISMFPVYGSFTHLQGMFMLWLFIILIYSLIHTLSSGPYLSCWSPDFTSEVNFLLYYPNEIALYFHILTALACFSVKEKKKLPL